MSVVKSYKSNTYRGQIVQKQYLSWSNRTKAILIVVKSFKSNNDCSQIVQKQYTDCSQIVQKQYTDCGSTLQTQYWLLSFRTDLCPHCSRLVLQMWQCYNPPLPIQVNTWDLLWHMCWYEGYIRLIYILCLQTLLHSNSQCRIRIPETSATTV